jgi:hypothetical protein
MLEMVSTDSVYTGLAPPQEGVNTRSAGHLVLWAREPIWNGTNYGCWD